MKKFIAIILLLLFSLQTFYAMTLSVWFWANRSYIAQTQWINKARPEMHCNGKCFLSKRLKEAEKKQEDNTSQLIKQSVETAPCLIPIMNFLQEIVTEKLLVHLPKKTTYTFNPTTDIFHPPCVAFS